MALCFNYFIISIAPRICYDVVLYIICAILTGTHTPHVDGKSGNSKPTRYMLVMWSQMTGGKQTVTSLSMGPLAERPALLLSNLLRRQSIAKIQSPTFWPAFKERVAMLAARVMGVLALLLLALVVTTLIHFVDLVVRRIARLVQTPLPCPVQQIRF